MEKQLTKKEIQQLFDFVEGQGLKFYDVQIEVVDHFASAIEANWETYPNDWSFEQKIASVYDELGFKGFRNLLMGKTVMVIRSANKLAFNFVKDAIKIPQIFVTIVLIYLLQQAFLSSENPHIFFGYIILSPSIILLLGTLVIYGRYLLSFKYKIHAFEQSISLVMWTCIVNYSFCLFNIRDLPSSPEMYLLISTMIILYFIFCMGILIVQWKIFLESRNRYEKLSKI